MTRTTYPVTCNCGHEGKIKLSENDQPYSTIWESWSLENLKGIIPPGNNLSAEIILKKGNIICPNCNRPLSINNLKNK